MLVCCVVFSHVVAAVWYNILFRLSYGNIKLFSQLDKYYGSLFSLCRAVCYLRKIYVNGNCCYLPCVWQGVVQETSLVVMAE